MITKINDLEGNLITNVVNTAILTPDIRKVENRLLDGTYHRQTIGDKINIITIICYVDEINKIKIDDLYVRDEPIKITIGDKFYIGLISDKDEWVKFSVTLYEAKFKLMVETEGLI